ncbi:MAG: trehalose-6-phosphate synthase [Dehalococcoidia bacterium]|nr:trehalose-6-phosphate synthase [Dehalococcoidia bacterium]MDW8119522.1 trehalose-6-phosphate synthase [Chloroflexota bacterium]
MTTVSPPASSDPLFNLCQEVLSKRRLLVVSNRGPLEYVLGPDGQPQPRRGGGTVVTALSYLLQRFPFTWIAGAMGEGDRKMLEQNPEGRVRSPLPGQKVTVRFVATHRRVYHKFYNIFCNPLLWFLHHYMWNAPHTPSVDAVVRDAWETGYVLVNRAFAEAVITEAGLEERPCLVMLHDYHLYLVPPQVRQAVPSAVVHYLVHLPWPEPRMWQLLPRDMREAIFQGLVASHIVGFQTRTDMLNFLQGCALFLPEAQVDFAGQTVTYRGHRVVVRCYPLSIDVEEVRRIAASSRAQEYYQRLLPLCLQHTIVRVDRAEPSKNIVRGFRSYALLLEKHPELRGKVVFLAFLVSSRTHIRQYERYMEEVRQTIDQINATYGAEGWKPIVLFEENNYTQAVAGLRLYDALLVNPVSDGMSLVAKEGPVVNGKAGVLVLSETAGAYEQLHEGAVGVAPADLEGTAEALYTVLTMSSEERQRRAALLRQAVEGYDQHRWLQEQFTDLLPLL